MTVYMKDQAFAQVLHYLRKNADLITKVSESEVRLTLPELRTPEEGLRYTIEGIVDIVRDGDETWMYDLKTHDRETIESNADLYRQQLNVYAYIWTRLRNRNLDGTAVISTALPSRLRSALRQGSPDAVAQAMEEWDSIVPLGYSEEEIDEMIEEFGRTVEDIENKRYAAPPVETLMEKKDGEKKTFAVAICMECDARFSCSSFREYVRQSDRGEQGLKRYLESHSTGTDIIEITEDHLIKT